MFVYTDINSYNIIYKYVSIFVYHVPLLYTYLIYKNIYSIIYWLYTHKYTLKSIYKYIYA